MNGEPYQICYITTATKSNRESFILGQKNKLGNGKK